MVEKALQPAQAAGPAEEPAVHADAQHLRPVERLRVAFGVEHVEGVAQVGEELLAGVEALRRGETHVVRVERVGHDEPLQHAAVAALDRHVERQVVAVVVGVVFVAAVVGHEPLRVRAVAPGVPAERPLALRHLANDLRAGGDVAALLELGHVLVVHPAPAVAGDLVAERDEGGGGLGVALQGHRRAEHRERQPALLELAQQPPHAGARAVFVDRLHRQMPRFVSLRADDFGEEDFRGRIAMQHAVLGALFVIEHELQRDARAVRPARVRRGAAVADEVARVVGRHALRFLTWGRG